MNMKMEVQTQEELFAADLDAAEEATEETITQTEEPTEQVDPAEELEVNAIQEFLREKGGIIDSTIRFEDDEGVITEKAWNDLTGAEQLQIFNDITETEKVETDSYQWSDDDAATIAYAKENKVSLADMVAAQVLELSKDVKTIPSVSTMSDDDLYLKDLSNVLGDEATDEYLKESLAVAKEDKFFSNKVGAIRDKFEAIEDNIARQNEADLQANQLEDYNQQVDYINTAISSIDNIQGFEVDDDAKQELSRQLTEITDTGETLFTAWVNQPENAATLAWYANYGDQAFKLMSDQVQTADQAGYDRAVKEFEDKTSRLPNTILRNVGTPPATVAGNTKKIMTVEELHANFNN